MRVQGVEVPSEVVTSLVCAMRQRTRRPFTYRTFRRLAMITMREHGVSKTDAGMIASRVADRLIQKHRRSGDLVHGPRRGRWRWGQRCGAKLHVESIGGMALYRTVGRVSVYRHMCPTCGMTSEGPRGGVCDDPAADARRAAGD